MRVSSVVSESVAFIDPSANSGIKPLHNKRKRSIVEVSTSAGSDVLKLKIPANLSISYVCSHSLFIIGHLYFSGIMAKCLVENGHPKDMCYDVIGCAQKIDTILLLTQLGGPM